MDRVTSMSAIVGLAWLMGACGTTTTPPAPFGATCGTTSDCASNMTCAERMCVGNHTVSGVVLEVVNPSLPLYVAVFQPPVENPLPVFDPARAKVHTVGDTSVTPATFTLPKVPSGTVTFLAYQIGDPAAFTYPVAYAIREVEVDETGNAIDRGEVVSPLWLVFNGSAKLP